MCPEVRWVHVSASSGCGLGVARFVRFHLVRPGAPMGSLVFFLLVHPRAP